MQWNYQKIKYFLKVAETLSFSKAAKELFISPQSLNKQIIVFEKELGEALFERTTRQVRLTEFGKRMQRAFKPAIEEFDKATETIGQYLQKKKKLIRIAFFQAISKTEVIVPITNYLRGLDKEIHVELLGGEIDEVIEWMHQGKCDLLITNTHEFEEWKDVEVIPFVRTPAQITVSLYHPWNAKDTLTVKDLEEMPILLMERKKTLERDSFYRKLKAKERLYAPNFSSLLANLEVGDCYAVIPKLFESMNHMGLQFLNLPKECEFYFEMVAIYPKDSPMAELLSNLKNLAEEGSINIT